MSLSETVPNIESLSNEQDDCIETTEVREWCAGECLGSGEMDEYARLCRDVAGRTSLHDCQNAPPFEKPPTERGD